MMVAEAAAPEKGAHVIDVCAAPGGKSIHLAEMLDGTGSVESRDLTGYKTGLIEENISRYQIKNMTTKTRHSDAFFPCFLVFADFSLIRFSRSAFNFVTDAHFIRLHTYHFHFYAFRLFLQAILLPCVTIETEL